MIVKYLSWEMWRTKGENKGDACRAVQRGLCEKIFVKCLRWLLNTYGGKILKVAIVKKKKGKKGGRY